MAGKESHSEFEQQRPFFKIMNMDCPGLAPSTFSPLNWF